MGRDRLERMTLREAEQKNPANDKHRLEKCQKVTIDNLRDRREQRELEDLRAEVARLNRQLELERDKLQLERKNGAKESDRKLIQKEVGHLEKQLKRAQDELDAVATARDEFKKRAQALQSELDNDHRLVQLRDELKASRDLAVRHAAQFEALEEESRVYKSRCKQLEDVQLELERERRQLQVDVDRDHEKARAEEKIAQLERELDDIGPKLLELTTSFAELKDKTETLESENKSLERHNARLIEPQEQLALSMTARPNDSDDVEKAIDANVASSSTLWLPPLFTTESPLPSNDQDLELENKRLKLAVTALEKKCEGLRKKQGSTTPFQDDSLSSSLVNGGHSSRTSAQGSSISERYRQLVENLSLSEDDVTLLLSSGPLWPPIRAQFPDSSVIDHLWMLTDHDAEFRDARSEWECERDRLDEELREALLERGGGIDGHEGGGGGGGGGRSNSAVGERGRERDGEADEEGKDVDAKLRKKEEEIKQLELRILAFEQGGRVVSKSSDDDKPDSGDRSPALSTVAGSSNTSTGLPRPAVNWLINTVKSLSKELASVREENTSLLLKFAGVE